MIKINRGLTLPISGEPKQEIDGAIVPKEVATTGLDYIGMKPTMLVKEGDSVKIGQPIFSCKKNIGLQFTAPAAGKVKAINRGKRRVFQSLVIEIDENEAHHSFGSYKDQDPASYTAEDARALLIESGAWASLRQRPFDKVADVSGKPAAIFITAIDTNPLAPNSSYIINKRTEDFKNGIQVLSKLTEGNTYVCLAPLMQFSMPNSSNIKIERFSGSHPAGLPGTHIHFLDPVNANKYVWHVGYQDVIAIGSLFKTGKLDTSRVISLAGPRAKNPRLVTTRVGADLSEVAATESTGDNNRVVSGSVFNGRTVEGSFSYLSHYTNQVTILEEDTKRELLGWHSPGFNKFSVKNIYLSKLNPLKYFDFGTSTHGSLRAIVPVGSFEKVMPLDILPTQLLRALVSKETDDAQNLGCLELAEEDLGLCTFVSPGKIDFGPILRENLTLIEKDG